jgi:tagaturonate reductase
VIDRFKNPNIAHQWISIAFHYTAKVKFRVVPMLLHHYIESDTVPERMACGFAAFIRFMRITQHNNERYTTEINGVEYLLNDGYAEKFYIAWQNNTIELVVDTILKDTTIWDNDLTRLNGFKESVINKLDAIMRGDTLSLLAELDLIKSKK